MADEDGFDFRKVFGLHGYLRDLVGIREKVRPQ
jgi:hypothetical protein